MALEFQGVLEKTDRVVDDNDMGKCVDNDRERDWIFFADTGASLCLPQKIYCSERADFPFFLLPVYGKLIPELCGYLSWISAFYQFCFFAGHVGYSAVIRYLLEGAQNNHHVSETCSENPERTDIRDLWIPGIFPQDQAEPRKMAAEKKRGPSRAAQ